MRPAGVPLGEARDFIDETGIPLLTPDAVVDAFMALLSAQRSGECWFVQPGRDPAPFRFANVPGPRRDGATVGLPPIAP